MWINVAWHVCKQCAREDKKGDFGVNDWQEDRRDAEAIATPFSFLFAFLFLAFFPSLVIKQKGIPAVLQRQKHVYCIYMSSASRLFSFLISSPQFFSNPLFFPHAILSLTFLQFFSLPLFFLLLWRTSGEKSIQYTGYWSTPITAEKKSVQGVGERRGTGHSDR